MRQTLKTSSGLALPNLDSSELGGAKHYYELVIFTNKVFGSNQVG